MNKVYFRKWIDVESFPLDLKYDFWTRIKGIRYGVTLKLDSTKRKEMSFKIALRYFRKAKNAVKYYIPPERTDCG